jgi:lipopolysaccharide export system permease protein
LIGNKLQRMIFWELVRVFLLALVGLTGLFLIGGVVQEASHRGLTPPQIIQVIPLLIPSTLPYTVPATVLFATCIVYGRMSHDHEITALRATGVHLGRLLTPALVMAALVTIGLGCLYYHAIPRSRQILADRVLSDVDELVCGMLKRQGCIRHPKLPFAVFVRDMRGNRLVDPVFKRRNADGSYGVIAHAKEAELWTDLTQDKVFIFMPNCAVTGSDTGGNVRDFTDGVSFPISTFTDTMVRPMNLTWSQVKTKKRELRDERSILEDQLETIGSQLQVAIEGRDQLETVKKNHQFRIGEINRIERQLRTEMHLRPVLALGCLFFALVAFPVGVWFHRADYLSTFVSCFLPIAFAYYPMVLAGTNLAKEGRVPAIVGVWTADLATLFVGITMSRKLFRQ